MRKIIHPNTTPAFSLHDMNVTDFKINDNNIIMNTQTGLVETTSPYIQLNGYIEFKDVKWDFSYVYLLGATGNTGTFVGEKLFLKDFIEKFVQFGFNVMDETYGYNLAKYSGYLLYQNQFRECIVEIYHEGDMIFYAEN